MWRRAYLLLLLVRIYFAFSPSYLHPDENFQGPEVIAGEIFTYPIHLTWEFTAEHPIRSVFPLWPIYGGPMLLLRWLWAGSGLEHGVEPAIVFWTLRALMLALSFVLEDWAVHELVPSPRERRVAVLLVASSYVTWTFQVHTFSNAIETLLVAWSLVMIRWITADQDRSSALTSAILGMLGVFGVFNRITFPAFVILPGLNLIPHFIRNPLSLFSFAASVLLTTIAAIYSDTAFYTSEPVTLSALLQKPVLTPINNLRYNTSITNLAEHGLHPFYQHLVVNLPQLLGPAFLLLLTTPRRTTQLFSALSGILTLSLSPHQESRFLLPAVPLILSSLNPPKRFFKPFIYTWLAFNAVMGLFMGTYHQGGIVPTQIYLSHQTPTPSHAFWWKTYSPPIWLLNGANARLKTHDLMGMPASEMLQEVQSTLEPCGGWTWGGKNETVLVAPSSAVFLDRFKQAHGFEGLRLRKVWEYRQHLNLDDMDFEEDGVWGTVKRVVGRRGLTTWRVEREC
ncbi:MAG: alpha 1,2 mannosyltransferase [Vezdaea aestivalis]|nr:MAG: alpha 1,2 mannosyltransferase [Vezdaea aestivalis]